MLINVKIKEKKMFFNGRTHGQLKTIVRNLTKNFFTDGRTTQNYSSEPHKKEECLSIIKTCQTSP